MAYYEFKNVRVASSDDFDEAMNRMGLDGWAFNGTTVKPSGDYVLTFRRMISARQAEARKMRTPPLPPLAFPHVTDPAEKRIEATMSFDELYALFVMSPRPKYNALPPWVRSTTTAAFDALRDDAEEFGKRLGLASPRYWAKALAVEFGKGRRHRP
jgi:hypothetical protein